jgi:aspartyl-tRNA synthetase
MTRKEIDALTEWVKRPQIGATGLVYLKYESNGEFKGSVDKFYNTSHYAKWAEATGAQLGDLMLVLAGAYAKTTKAASELRLEMGQRLGLRDPDKFKALWVTDFPMFDYDKENDTLHAMHHPFTRPTETTKFYMGDSEARCPSVFYATAAAYDLVLNGTELGGGSIRIHEQDLQQAVFKLLGFSEEQAREQFGFLLDAFQYGAPPHGGIAFGLDRLCALMMGTDSIRDVMAFPKNNQGRDTMLDAPAPLEGPQLAELGLVTSVTPEPKVE